MSKCLGFHKVIQNYGIGSTKQSQKQILNEIEEKTNKRADKEIHHVLRWLHWKWLGPSEKRPMPSPALYRTQAWRTIMMAP